MNITIILILISQILAPSASITQSNVTRAINITRTQAKVRNLYNSAILTNIATIRATSLCYRNVLNHNGWNEGVNDIAFRQTGFSIRGENLARGYSTTKSLMQGWLNSSTHRNNMVDSRYKAVGVGVFTCNNGTYTVTYFGG